MPPEPSDTSRLRDAIRYARANGWRYDGTGTEKTWERPGQALIGVEINKCHHEGCDDSADLNTIIDGYESSIIVLGVQQGLDVLVALGVLPAQFSTAYAAGRASVLDGAEERWRVHRDNIGTLTVHRAESDAQQWADTLRREGIHDAHVEHRLEPKPTPWQPVDVTAVRPRPEPDTDGMR